jgi:hypothetical protein
MFIVDFLRFAYCVRFAHPADNILEKRLTVKEEDGQFEQVLRSEPVFLNVYVAPELIPRNEFYQPT